MAESGFSQSSAADQQAFPPTNAARPIWPWMLLLVGVAVVMGLRSFWMPDSAGGRDGTAAAGVGTKLPALALQPLTGDATPVSLADLQDKVTLINFWGPWCGPCAVEFPHLMELEQHFRSQPDFQFLSVSSNPDPRDVEGLAESTTEFLRQHRADILTYRDADAQTISGLVSSAKLSGFGFPTTVILDRGGVIRGVWVGYQQGDERGMQAAVDRLLAGAAELPK